MYGKDNALVTSDWREAPAPDPESSLIGTIYEGYPAVAPYVVASSGSWVFAGTGVTEGARFGHLVGVEYDRVNPAYPVPRPIQVLSHSPLTCQGARSFGDSAYYTHPGGAGVFNAGTMRWVEAIFGDRPHGIAPAASAFVKQVTANVLRAFADGPAAAGYPARDNLDAMHEFTGDPIGSPANLQLSPLPEQPVQHVAPLRPLPEQLVKHLVEAAGQARQEPLALGGAGPGRIAEHAVRADGAHALLAQHRHDLGERPDVTPLGRVQVHRLRVEREHDRGLRPAGVGVAARQPGVPGRAGAALITEPPDGCLNRGGVPAVPVDHQQGGPVQAGVPPQFDQAGGQRLGADRQRPGERRVLPAGAYAERRSQRHAVPARAGAPGHGHRDPGVSVKRQVRPVLLKRPDRHHKQPPRPRLDIRPPHPRQLQDRHRP
jgi:hypothetical protein